MGVSERVIAAQGTSSVASLFASDYARLVRHLSVVAQSREAAAEAVQEAFVQAHLHWDRVGGYDDPVGWVRRVAINRIRNHHRGVARARAALRRLASDTPVVAPEPVVDRVEVARALALLSAKQRLAVVLHHLEGLPVADTAREMGVSPGTVKAHLHRARAALRPLLEDHDG